MEENRYAAEVIADASGEWVGNGCRFPTAEKAREYAVDLYARWTAVREWRIVEYVPTGWGLRKPQVVLP